MMRIERGVRLQLKAMAYDAADLYLDGLEDYLKGPEYFASLNGEAVMKEKGARNEKLLPLEQLEPQYRDIAYSKRLLGEISYIDVPLKLIRSLPYDRHLLPDRLLRDTPEVVFYSGLSVFSPRTTATKTLVAMDLDGQHAAVRHMDRVRYRQVMDRLKRLKAEMKERGDEVRRAYKDAQPYLTSVEFWEKHLGLDGGASD